jgi:hypothetical protein
MNNAENILFGKPGVLHTERNRAQEFFMELG